MAGKPKLKWEEPPVSTGSDKSLWGAHFGIAEALKTKPGTWALVRSYASPNAAASTAWLIRNGRLRAYQPAGAFEAKSRRSGDEGRVYARYVGGEESHA